MKLHIPTSADISQWLTYDNSLSLIWCAVSVTVSILVMLVLRQRIKNYFANAAPNDTTKKEWKRSIYRRFLPLVAPALNIMLWLVGVVVLRKMEFLPSLIVQLEPLAFAWLIVVAVFVITQSRGKSIFTAILILPFALPGAAPYIEDGRKMLQDISFEAGKLKIDAYMVIKLIITVILLQWIASAIVSGIDISLGRVRHIRSSTRQLLQNIMTTVVYVTAGLVALSIIGIDLTAFAVMGGAIGVGLGFGLQKIASNFISGLILLLERNIQVNDLIEIAGTNVFGLVKHTGARYTMVATLDNREIMIPNEDFISQRVINWTHTDTKGLIKMQIGVSYDADIEKARDLMLEAATEHPRVLHDPAPGCTLEQFGASSVDFSLTVWIADIRDAKGVVKSEILFTIWHKFKKAGIEIPYPQMDLRVRQLPTAPDTAPSQYEATAPDADGA